MKKQKSLAVSLLLVATLILPPTGLTSVNLGPNTFMGLSDGWIGLYSTGGLATFTEIRPVLTIDQTRIPSPVVEWTAWKSQNYIVIGDRFTDNVFILAYSPGCLLLTGSLTIPGFEWVGIAGDDRFYIKGANGIVLVDAEGKIAGWPQHASPSPPLIPHIRHLPPTQAKAVCHQTVVELTGTGLGKRVTVGTASGKISTPIWLQSPELPFYLSDKLKAYKIGEDKVVIISNNSISLWALSGQKLKLLKWRQLPEEEIPIGPLLAKPNGPVVDFISGARLLPYVSADVLANWLAGNACDVYNILIGLRVFTCGGR